MEWSLKNNTYLLYDSHHINFGNGIEAGNRQVHSNVQWITCEYNVIKEDNI